MNCNNYQKIVHASLWCRGKIALAQVLKNSYHKGYWSDCGGKVEKNESLIKAVAREAREETGLLLFENEFNLIDCFIYPERKLKTFLFEVKLKDYEINNLENTEPHKQSDWQWFTKEEALKKLLMPSVKFYLENIT